MHLIILLLFLLLSFWVMILGAAIQGEFFAEMSLVG
jgi:hypothetical protein